MTLFIGPDGDPRCSWVGGAPDFLKYHDTEWGFPVHDDVRLFEKLCLEGFQAGLSWRVVLSKRENFRAAFAGFDFVTVANFTDDDVERLVNDTGIVRHRGKIEAVINNAQRAIEMCEQEGSLDNYFWSHQPDPEEVPVPMSLTTSPTATDVSKDLKRRGWKFVGPTTLFAFMQANGMINDHAKGCVVRQQVEDLRD